MNRRTFLNLLPLPFLIRESRTWGAQARMVDASTDPWNDYVRRVLPCETQVDSYGDTWTTAIKFGPHGTWDHTLDGRKVPPSIPASAAKLWSNTRTGELKWLPLFWPYSIDRGVSTTPHSWA